MKITRPGNRDWHNDTYNVEMAYEWTHERGNGNSVGGEAMARFETSEDAMKFLSDYNKNGWTCKIVSFRELGTRYNKAMLELATLKRAIRNARMMAEIVPEAAITLLKNLEE